MNWGGKMFILKKNSIYQQKLVRLPTEITNGNTELKEGEFWQWKDVYWKFRDIY